MWFLSSLICCSVVPRVRGLEGGESHESKSDMGSSDGLSSIMGPQPSLSKGPKFLLIVWMSTWRSGMNERVCCLDNNSELPYSPVGSGQGTWKVR